MTGWGNRVASDRSTSVSIGLVVGDGEEGRTLATRLADAAPRFEPSVYTEPGAVDAADLDCAVVERTVSWATDRDVCRQIRGEHGALPVVVLIEAGDVADPPGAADGPTDYHVSVGGDVRPRALARRIETAVRADGAEWRGPTRGYLRALLGELATPMAVTDASGDVDLTNPAYKATFGLAEALPEGLPDADDANRVAVECETLDGRHHFRYSAIHLGEGRTCHVLREQSASAPLASDAAEGTPPVESAATADHGLSLDELTDRQREVLETAVEGGFFERPKAHGSEELAARLDITRSTFLQHLRAAQRKLFDDLAE